MQSDVSLNGLWRGGTLTSSGGSTNEDVTFKHKESVTDFDGRVGFVSDSGVGGGLFLQVAKTAGTDSADIDTKATSKTDSDSISNSDSTTSVTPHLSFGQVASGTGSGFATSLGYNLRSNRSSRTVTIAGADAPSDDATAKTGGLVLVGKFQAAEWGVTLSLAPGAKGTIEAGSADSVSRTDSRYTIEAECSKGYRLGFDMRTVKDDYPTESLSGSDWALRFDTTVKPPSDLLLIPQVFYRSEKRSRGDSTASKGTLGIGTRVTKPGPQTYYTGIAFEYQTGKEERGADRPSSQLKAFGFGLTLGMNI